MIACFALLVLIALSAWGRVTLAGSRGLHGCFIGNMVIDCRVIWFGNDRIDHIEAVESTEWRGIEVMP